MSECRLSTIFPRPQWVQAGDVTHRLARPTGIYCTDDICRGTAERLAAVLHERWNHTVHFEQSGEITVGLLSNPAIKQLLTTRGVDVCPEVRRPGGYLLIADADGVLLAAHDATGAFYGSQTLVQLVIPLDGAPHFREIRIQDWPHKPIRGVHLYVPGREQIPFFKQFLEWLAAIKVNTLFLEVSGGMEYERHPEINRAWQEFCKTANAFPGGPRALQDSQPFVKDSTHTELARGSFLLKSEMADLVQFARDLHIQVVPEVQSFSHAYYLCMAHPEIAERDDDPYPDTYCPSNPRTYEILFDVLEEVIQVFEPSLIHMGHDEIIHLGLCPRCRGKSGAELLAGDICRIHEFLSERGIRMMIWGDKLIPVVVRGVMGGGMEMDESNSYWGRANHIPATYGAIRQIPKDILICDWYWTQDARSYEYFIGEGFEVVFGNMGNNFAAQKFDRWHERGVRPEVLGAEVSTWCDVSEFAFGYNGCFFNMLYVAQMLWWSHYRDLDRELVTAQVAEMTRALRQTLSGIQRERRAEALPIPVAVDTPPDPPFLSGASLCLPSDVPFVLPEEGALCGVDAAHPTAQVGIGRKCDRLLLLHTCSTAYTRRPTWALDDPFSYPPQDLIVTYAVRYADGTQVEVPIYYGSHVARWDVPYGEHVDAIPYHADPVPVGRDPAGRRVTLYSYEWLNPHPDKAIQSLGLTYKRGEGGFWLLAIAAGDDQP